MPVSAVQDPNMGRYVASLNPHASLPSRWKLQGLIKTLSDKNLLKIREALSTARQVSVTTDIWSSKLSTDSYIGVTCHFINPQTKRRQWLTISKLIFCSCEINILNVLILGCQKFNVAHTGPNIASILLSIFKSYHIEDKVWFVLTDSGTNMIKGNGFY